MADLSRMKKLRASLKKSREMSSCAGGNSNLNWFYS
jgi:hypothetical protein